MVDDLMDVKAAARKNENIRLSMNDQ
jgi:hypothetical protein